MTVDQDMQLKLLAKIVFCALLGISPSSRVAGLENSESDAKSFLAEYDWKYSQACHKTVVASWNYATNITDANEKIDLQESLEYSNFLKEGTRNITCQFPCWRNFQDPTLLRMFKILTVLGTDALPENDLKQYQKLINDMSRIYSTTKICAYGDSSNCSLSLEPEIIKIMKESHDEKLLRHTWTEWHDKVGNPIRKHYPAYVELSNKAARLNNYRDAGAFWLREYEVESFKDDVEGLLQNLKPLYEQMHAYVRAKLRLIYVDQIGDDGLIPAHLLGDVWAQFWQNIFPLVAPYPGKVSIDVTQQMKKQGYTPLKMFQISDEFFTSLGLIPMPKEFWEGSMIEKPSDREVVCHASAWDLCNRKDYRIKQCTDVTTEDLVTVHHEMGHIQYFLQYKNLPKVFRQGGNPGFHEALGDTIALSVKTPRHLKEIGLLDANTPIDDYETTINFLMSMALEKVAFLPYAYLIDKYRWAIFDGTVNSTDYNRYWWKLRREYQGVRPPSERSEINFDAAALYHISADVEYLRYFVSTVIQFQFHRALCLEADQYDPNDPNKPLHNCDIYRSKAAGSKLANGLAMGLSRPWPEVMNVITGQEKMDASAIREYFKPLEDWLIKKNAELCETPGW